MEGKEGEREGGEEEGRGREEGGREGRWEEGGREAGGWREGGRDGGRGGKGRGRETLNMSLTKKSDKILPNSLRDHIIFCTTGKSGMHTAESQQCKDRLGTGYWGSTCLLQTSLVESVPTLSPSLQHWHRHQASPPLPMWGWWVAGVRGWR